MQPPFHFFAPPPLRPRGRRTTSPWECDACDKTFGSRSSAFSCARCGYDVCPACRGAVDAWESDRLAFVDAGDRGLALTPVTEAALACWARDRALN